MKLSFSTKGWANYSWDATVNLAQDMDFNGIEVFDVTKNEELIDKGCPFHLYNTHATARELHKCGLSIPVLNTSIDIADGADHTKELTALINIASEVFATGVCVTAVAGNEEAARASLYAIMPYAEEKHI